MTRQQPVTQQMHAAVYTVWCDAIASQQPANLREAIREANRQLYAQLGYAANVRVRDLDDEQLRAVIALRREQVGL